MEEEEEDEDEEEEEPVTDLPTYLDPVRILVEASTLGCFPVLVFSPRGSALL